MDQKKKNTVCVCVLFVVVCVYLIYLQKLI